MNMMGVDESQYDEIALKKIKELRLDDIDVTPDEDTDMVLKSNMLIISEMTVKQYFCWIKLDIKKTLCWW